MRRCWAVTAPVAGDGYVARKPKTEDYARRARADGVAQSDDGFSPGWPFGYGMRRCLEVALTFLLTEQELCYTMFKIV